MGFTYGYECVAPLGLAFEVTLYTIPGICHFLSILSVFISVHPWQSATKGGKYIGGSTYIIGGDKFLWLSEQ
ncbi:hypothetical protein Echvi_3281 [Echinicola vietnamensis DSM 17526]|uniref:Uncharacterized protein n=1 Tax=Echinicola vietnamensis (strain DSM 17526 / LMG 23754 / KMM 6221) TaxID=926556 RepID=L0G3W7_ECHVK|nr:hypothetical protein Echvi_3281 [Echinicola vietnamensis DSM 17526]